jgi:hypothetical protein
MDRFWCLEEALDSKKNEFQELVVFLSMSELSCPLFVSLLPTHNSLYSMYLHIYMVLLSYYSLIFSNIAHMLYLCTYSTYIAHISYLLYFFLAIKLPWLL